MLTAVRGVGQLLGCPVETAWNHWRPPSARDKEPVWTDGT